MRIPFLIFLFLIIATPHNSNAQGEAIGYWRSHQSYRTPNSLATDGTTLYVSTSYGFFTHNLITHETKTYSKVDGMADVLTTAVAYDATTETAVIAYQNSDIDLFQNDQFYNIPYLKLKAVTGDKTIKEIYTQNGFAYLATDIGEIVLNLAKKEVKETYVFNSNNAIIPIQSFVAIENQYYAATPNGLYTANSLSGNLLAFTNWQKLSDRQFSHLTVANNSLFAANRDSVFKLTNSSLAYFYKKDTSIVNINGGTNALYIAEFYNREPRYGKVYTLDLNGNIIDSTKFGSPLQTVALSDQNIWVADGYNGITNAFGNTITPIGPYGNKAYDIMVDNKNLYVMHGALTEDLKENFSRDGVSHFYDEKWNYYNHNTQQIFADSDVMDILSMAFDPASKSIYWGTVKKGLFELKSNGTLLNYKQGYIDKDQNQFDYYPANSLALDTKGNLWITQFGANRQLAVKSKSGNWYYSKPVINNGLYYNTANNLIIDDYNQKWFCNYDFGVTVYNDNGTIENNSDDKYRVLKFGAGVGNLPGKMAYCLAKDKEGLIWIGTDQGIGIVNCPNQVISGECEAEIRIVQYDQFAGYLFQNEKIKSIAVDGANRKWIGTNNGVWLISADASKIINRFTIDNSPLPSNHIIKISIDGYTGDVYIGTDNGLVSYKSTATEGNTNNTRVITYPNPIPSAYKGTISITGLVTDADVRITDITGKLVYKTKANGGEAIWNGNDYQGNRPQTGVYLVFITNKDGSETFVSKMLFEH